MLSKITTFLNLTRYLMGIVTDSELLSITRCVWRQNLNELHIFSPVYQTKTHSNTRTLSLSYTDTSLTKTGSQYVHINQVFKTGIQPDSPFQAPFPIPIYRETTPASPKPIGTPENHTKGLKMLPTSEQFCTKWRSDPFGHPCNVLLSNHGLTPHSPS